MVVTSLFPTFLVYFTSCALSMFVTCHSRLPPPISSKVKNRGKGA